MHTFQVELKTGQTYRGELHDAEDNWNCQLKNVTFTERVGVRAKYVAGT